MMGLRMSPLSEAGAENKSQKARRRSVDMRTREQIEFRFGQNTRQPATGDGGIPASGCRNGADVEEALRRVRLRHEPFRFRI